jgi:hypothetical protein
MAYLTVSSYAAASQLSALQFQAHSSVEKAGLIGLVKMRYIESDQDLTLRGDRLLEAISKDKDKGLIPFFVSTDDPSVAGNPVFESEKKLFLKVGYLIHLHLVSRSRMVELNLHFPRRIHGVVLN